MTTAITVETLNKIHCIFKYHERFEDASETETEESSMSFFHRVVMVRCGDGTLTAIDSLHGVVLVNISIIISYHFD